MELEQKERIGKLPERLSRSHSLLPQSKYSATKVISSLFLKPSDTFWVDNPNLEPKKQKDYVLYIGCNVLQTPFLLMDCVHVLEKMGIDFAVVGGTNLCCGSPLLASGKVQAAESFDRRRMQFFGKFKPKVVIEWDESCNEFTHINTLRYLHPSYEIVNIEKFLASNLSLCNFSMAKKPERIAIHDHYGHNAKSIADFKSPRKVLSAIPGVEVVEMEHSKHDALECGFDLLMRDKKGAKSANEKVLQEAKAARATTFLVMWQACYRTFVTSEITHGIKTRHFIDIVAEAMGLGGTSNDRYKEYRISGNVDRALEESRENIEANGYSVEEIRPYVEKYLLSFDNESFC